MAHKGSAVAAAIPPTIRALMARKGLWTFTELSEKTSGIAKREDITRISQGWKGTDRIRAALARALGCTSDDILIAAKAAHDED